MADRILAVDLTRCVGTQRVHVTVASVVIAGWTGRDRQSLEKHIAELEALGVKRPASTPIFYRVSVPRLTTGAVIETLGTESAGEVEFVLLQHGGELWVGAGSDHTDRRVETYDVGVSKQMCEKPVAPVFWPFAEVAAHWEQLILRSYIGESSRTLYQSGTVASLLEPQNLIRRYTGKDALAEGTLMFCGTLAVQGGVRAADQFALELTDPVLSRAIRHEYRVVPLPVVT